jgi:hypothetical protein
MAADKRLPVSEETLRRAQELKTGQTHDELVSEALDYYETVKRTRAEASPADLRNLLVRTNRRALAGRALDLRSEPAEELTPLESAIDSA